MILVISSCENSFNPEFTLAWDPPVVNSVVVSNLVSEEHMLDVWNYEGPLTTVAFSEIKDLYVNFNPLYLNPNNKSGPRTNISFVVPSSSKVRLYILPARTPNEDPQKVVQRFSGDPFLKLNNGGLLLVDDSLQAGSHSIPFEPVALGLPSGFYIYVIEAGDFQSKRNLYFASNCNEALPELKEFIIDCRE